MEKNFNKSIEEVSKKLNECLNGRRYKCAVKDSSINIYFDKDRVAPKNIKAVIYAKNRIDWKENYELKERMGRFILNALKTIDKVEEVSENNDNKEEEQKGYWFVLYGCGDGRFDNYGWTALDKDEFTRSAASRRGTAAAKRLGERNYNYYFCTKRTYVTDSIDAFRNKCIKDAGFTPNLSQFETK